MYSLACVHIWKSGQLLGMEFFFHHVKSSDQTRVTRLINLTIIASMEFTVPLVDNMEDFPF